MVDYEAPLTEEEREEIVELYDGLRVADVVDGLDSYGFNRYVNQMSQDIQALHHDYEDFTHQIMGFAHTMRFLPTNKPQYNPDEWGWEAVHSEWGWYEDHVESPSDITDGDIIVFEAHNVPVGMIGSYNGLDWVSQGANGIVTNSGARDTDELVIEGVPVYSKTRTKPKWHGRAEFDDEQIPVNVGECQVRPDDVIVADGDGVVVVPVEYARRVAEAGSKELESDQEMRGELYDEAGLERDHTLE